MLITTEISLLSLDADNGLVFMVVSLSIRTWSHTVFTNFDFGAVGILRIRSERMNLDFSFDGDAVFSLSFTDGTNELVSVAIVGFGSRWAVQIGLMLKKKSFRCHIREKSMVSESYSSQLVVKIYLKIRTNKKQRLTRPSSRQSLSNL